jgi:hypothetical protein
MKTIMAARSSRDVSSQAQCSSARTFSTQCACRSAAPFSQQRMLNDEERFTAVSINRRMAGRSRPCDIEVKLQCRNQRTEQLCLTAVRGMLIEIPTPQVLLGVAGHHSLPLQRMSGLNGCSQPPRQLFWPSGMGETGEGYIRDSPTRPTRIG